MSAVAETLGLPARLAAFPRAPDHHPWPRFVVTPEAWLDLGEALAAGRLDLLGLLADGETVHAVLFEPDTRELAVASLPCEQGRYPSLGRLHPPALRPERAIRDLHGLVADGSPDARPWLDHGRWPGSRAEAKERLPLPPGRGRGPAPDPGRARSTPASSSPATSASPATARRWSGSRSGSATSTRGSRPSSPGPTSSGRPGSPPASRATARWPTRPPSPGRWRPRPAARRRRGRSGCGR